MLSENHADPLEVFQIAVTTRSVVASWKTANEMPEAEFWAIVKDLGWDKKADYDSIKKKLLGTLPAPKLIALRFTYDRFYKQLKAGVEAYEAAMGISAGTGDDGFWDLISTIVGLGEKEYYATLKEPQRAIDRARKGDYGENFSYGLPTVDDLRNLDVEIYKDRAKEYAAEYRALVLGPPTSVQDQAQTVLGALMDLHMGSYQAFLKAETKVKKALEAIDKGLQQPDDPNSGEPGSKKHAVLNLFGDIRTYLLWPV